MKFTILLLATLTFSGGPVLTSRAAEAPDPTVPPGRQTREEMRERMKNLTPEERQKMMNQLRERAGGTGLNGPEMDKRRAEMEKMRQELKDLPPAERAARIQAFRETNTVLRPGVSNLRPEETEARRKQFQERIAKELEQLKAKKSAGTITEEESRRLERMTEWSKKLESVPAGGGAKGYGLERRPPIEDQLPKPVEPAKPSTPPAPK